MIAPAAVSLTALLALAVTTAPARACTIRFDEPEARPGVEIVGFVRQNDRIGERDGGAFSPSPRVLRIETIRTVRGERRPEWRIAIRMFPPDRPPPAFGEGPYRFAFDLPEAAAPSALADMRPGGSDLPMATILISSCGEPAFRPVSRYSPDVLLARAAAAPAAPFVAGLAALAGAGLLLRRVRRRA